MEATLQKLLGSGISYPSLSLIIPGTLRGDHKNERATIGVQHACKEALAIVQQTVTPKLYTHIHDRLMQLTSQYDPLMMPQGVAFFVNTDVSVIMPLKESAEYTVAVGSIFAMRELLELVRTYTPYVVLVLSDKEARLITGHFDGIAKEFLSAQLTADSGVAHGFPYKDDTLRERFAHAVAEGDRGADYRDSRTQDFFRRVDQELHVTLTTYHMPQKVMLCTLPEYKSIFERVSKHPQIIAMHCPHDYINYTPERLAKAIIPVLKEAHAQELQAMYTAFEGSINTKKQAYGLNWVWEAAHAGKVRTLLVERGYQVRGRIDPDNAFHLQPFMGPSEVPLDNLVERVVYEVLQRDGEVQVFPNKALQQYECIGAILRY